MRPVGEIRAAIEAAVQAKGRGTYIDFADAAQVGYDAAKQAIKDMVRARRLVPVDHQTLPHSKRPLLVYEFSEASNEPQMDLLQAMRGWAATS